MDERQYFDNLLDECLNQLEPDGSNLETILAQYPKHVAELRPFLQTVLELQTRADELRWLWQEVLNVRLVGIETSPTAKRATRDRLFFAVSRKRFELLFQGDDPQEKMPMALVGT